MAQSNRKGTDLPWSSPALNSHQPSLKEIQALQMEEARRQQERAMRNAQEAAEAQQSAVMWAQQQAAGRPMSLLEIQEEELRHKEMQERAKAAQMQSKMASPGMWGSTWGSGPAASFADIQQQQQAVAAQTAHTQEPGAGGMWGGTEPGWDDNALLWDPAAARGPPSKPVPVTK